MIDGGFQPSLIRATRGRLQLRCKTPSQLRSVLAFAESSALVSWLTSIGLPGSWTAPAPQLQLHARATDDTGKEGPSVCGGATGGAHERWHRASARFWMRCSGSLTALWCLYWKRSPALVAHPVK